MDKEIETLLQKVKEANRTPFWQSTPEAARSGPMLMTLLFGDAPPVQRVEDFTIPSSGGFALPVRLYVPTNEPSGLIVYFHGGGWVIGTVAGYHPMTATLANRTGCAVLSVDYRLAPENPYPVPVEDALAAIRWAAEQGASAIGAEPHALVAMGDSAGGNLATVASRLHNERDPARRVDLQVLAYPVTGHDFDTASYLEFAEGNLLTRSDMKWFWDHYCPDGAQRSNPDVSPLHAKDLSASPAALVLTAGRDPLRDEGEAYGERLKQAGVPAEIVRCEGLLHGFLAMINYAPSAGRAFDRIVDAIVRSASK
ncbi:Carboxylesterase NlhH [Variovorax sp. PBL-H6]|uniref:alpha/beta hydrolase n=1 Tax=Variovorax sp. PBL-H6 TaxID=434009 RepID=UPI00131813DA|nr:alpha/beta hydrolase [Variovorax sp. PBL-H6]VTU31790.1 Carboxylesterase NlhH [Variovorax sp. PBL-H6]